MDSDSTDSHAPVIYHNIPDECIGAGLVTSVARIAGGYFLRIPVNDYQQNNVDNQGAQEC